MYFSSHNFKLMMNIAGEHGINQAIIVDSFSGLLDSEIARRIFKAAVDPKTVYKECDGAIDCGNCVIFDVCLMKNKEVRF